MEKEFTPYEIALGLKELGFDEKTLGFYDYPSKEFIKLDSFGNFEGLYKYRVTAPLYQQAFRFFRERYGYFTSPTQSTKQKDVTYDWLITKQIDESKIFIKTVGYFPTYQEAELECLVKLIDIVKKQNLKD